MQPIVTNLTALAVAVLYYLWRAYHQNLQQRRRRILCQRVAHLLWTAAGQIKSGDSGQWATNRD